MRSINFTERLNGYNPEAPQLIELVDAVNAAADRACSILIMLSNSFSTGASELSPQQISDVLEESMLEVGDIKRLVSHYYDAQHEGVSNDNSN